MKVEKKITNEFTGEIRTIESKYPDIMNEEGYLFWIRRKQCRTFNEIDLPESLTYAERGRFLNVKKHIEKDTNCLVKKTKFGYTHMTDEDVMTALDMSDKHAKSLLNKLVMSGVLARVHIYTNKEQAQKIYVNPIYFHAGKRLTPELYRLFAEWLDPYLEPWVANQMKRTDLE